MSLIASLVLVCLAVLPLPASAWNPPGHMLAGAIAYQVLQQENPRTIEQAARWPDDVRTQDKAQNRPPWHYINLPFKPEGQPDSVQVREPETVNILSAMAQNERVLRNSNSDVEQKAIGLDGSSI